MLFTRGQTYLFQFVRKYDNVLFAPLRAFVAVKDRVFQAFPGGLRGDGVFGVYLASASHSVAFTS